MEYGYWKPKKSTTKAPALREKEKCLKNDKAGTRQYDRRLLTFQDTPYEQMLALDQIKLFRGSRTKLHEWRVILPNNRSGRMMFVVYSGGAAFLHFFIKKSTAGSRTPPENLHLAEQRAEQFRQEEQEEKLIN